MKEKKNVWDDVSVCFFLWKVAGLAEADLKKGVTLVSFLHWLPSTRFLLERRKCLVWERFILALIHVHCRDKKSFLV